MESLTETEILSQKDNICFELLLPKKKLSEKTLEKLIGHINLRQVLQTQKLSLEFICKYVLNEKLYQHDDEKTITIGLVIAHQPYTVEEINHYLKK